MVRRITLLLYALCIFLLGFLLGRRPFQLEKVDKTHGHLKFWKYVHRMVPNNGETYHISNFQCRQLHMISKRVPVIAVFSLARSAASTLTSEISRRVNGLYLDEIFNEHVSLSKFLNGTKPRHSIDEPAELLNEIMHEFKRPLVFKMNDPGQLPLATLSKLSSCIHWCPIILERESVRDRWCSFVRAKMTGYWGTRKKGRKEMPCPYTYGEHNFRQFAKEHSEWYRDLGRLLRNSIYVTFEQVVSNLPMVVEDLHRYCSHYVRKRNAVISFHSKTNLTN